MIMTGGNQELTAESLKKAKFHEPTDLITHCAYDASSATMDHDVGLIRMSKNIKFNRYTQPIALDPKTVPVGAKLLIVGFGFIKYKPKPVITTEMHMLHMKRISQKTCSKAMQLNIRSNIICVYRTVNRGICHGDSGSPFTLKRKLVGLASWGLPCAEGYPDMVASIAYHYNGIIKTMRKYNKKHSTKCIP
ncbi:chymotrypsin-1-like [Scaptodrosophila lebanonensis]|uniref:Chymotrypsin-1-like n=1 Tax=Drosophila lebanonensis TaxID=7225 RepID=A0A6J2T8F7_DROLE|nr:chymotrypsin-1-like [Scaptodrosophila lebanonensis]